MRRDTKLAVHHPVVWLLVPLLLVCLKPYLQLGQVPYGFLAFGLLTLALFPRITLSASGLRIRRPIEALLLQPGHFVPFEELERMDLDTHKQLSVTTRDGRRHVLGRNEPWIVGGFVQAVNLIVSRTRTAEREAIRRLAAAPPQIDPRVEADIRCPYCRDDLLGAHAPACSDCGTFHHRECLLEHGACSVLGCSGRLQQVLA